MLLKLQIERRRAREIKWVL